MLRYGLNECLLVGGVPETEFISAVVLPEEVPAIVSKDGCNVNDVAEIGLLDARPVSRERGRFVDFEVAYPMVLSVSTISKNM